MQAGMKKSSGIEQREASPLRVIKRRISENGPMTFSEFMGLALYHPESGYYCSSRQRWGKKGDYITSLDISPVFGTALAASFHEMWQSLGSPGGFHLIEAGSGRGYLARWVVKTIRERYPEFAKSLIASVVDKGRAYDAEGLSGGPGCDDDIDLGIKAYESLDEIKAPISGCIFSNELIDALPVHLVVMRSGKLREIYVTDSAESGKGLFFTEGEPSSTELERYFEELDISLDEGQKAEVSLEAIEWVESAADLLDKGFVLTIDYGMPAKTLYASGRQGTLLCHYKHTINDEPLLRVGEQDITAHVDFTSLKRAGDGAGLEVTGFATQGNFLMASGVLDELTSAAEDGVMSVEDIKHNQGIKDLVLPGGAGDTFKVLVQHKGLKRPCLSGFSISNLADRL